MAEYIIFEDNSAALSQIFNETRRAGHNLMHAASTLEKSFEILTSIINDELQPDAVLLDANLNARTRSVEAFEYSRPVDPEVLATKGLIGRLFAPKIEHIHVPVDYRFGGDGRTIRNILDIFNVQTPVIGISGDSMEEQQIRVDYEPGKYNITGIIAALDDIDIKKNP